MDSPATTWPDLAMKISRTISGHYHENMGVYEIGEALTALQAVVGGLVSVAPVKGGDTEREAMLLVFGEMLMKRWEEKKQERR